MSQTGVWPCRMRGIISNHLDPVENPRDARVVAHRESALRRARILDDLTQRELLQTSEEPVTPFDFRDPRLIVVHTRDVQTDIIEATDDEDDPEVFDLDEAADYGFHLLTV